MKTSTRSSVAIGAVLGVTLLLAGCGSDQSGSAAPVTAPPSAESSAPMFTDGLTTTPAPTSDSELPPTTSVPVESSELPPAPTLPTLPTLPSPDPIQPSDPSDPLEPPFDTTEPETPTTTLAEGVTELDDATYTWFNIMCTGLEPLMNMDSYLTDFDPGATEEEMMAQLSERVMVMGDSMKQTAVSLSGVASPTFEHGAELSAQMIGALDAMGDLFHQLGEGVATGDLAALDAMSDGLDAIEEEFGVADLEFSDTFQAALETIPSCAEVGLGT